MKTAALQKMSASALLIAIGIIIPMFSPVKFILEPASFTLASHVAVFIALMISPSVAVAVAIGTTLGFLLGGFPVVVVLRAASHIVFAVLGSLFLQRFPRTLESPIRTREFSLAVGLLHAACELVIVSIFYMAGGMGEAYYQQGFLRTVILLVGIGSVVHSMVDFELALAVVKVLGKQRSFATLTNRAA